VNKDEKAHIAKVVENGCIICQQPAEAHHLTGAGMGLKSSNYEVIALCPRHHRYEEGIHHIGKQTWELKYGTQQELLEKTRLGLSCG